MEKRKKCQRKDSQGQQQDGWNAPVWGSSYASGPYNSMGKQFNQQFKVNQLRMRNRGKVNKGKIKK